MWAMNEFAKLVFVSFS